MRGTGECLISLATRPKISREILANCGVLISFQNHMQKDLMTELLNLSEKEKENLSQLRRGQCIVRINSIEKPFILDIPYIHREWLTNKEIFHNNKSILEKKLKKSEKKNDKNLDKKKEVEEKKAYCSFCGKDIDPHTEYCQDCKVKLGEKDKDFEELKILVSNLTKE